MIGSSDAMAIPGASVIGAQFTGGQYGVVEVVVVVVDDVVLEVAT